MGVEYDLREFNLQNSCKRKERAGETQVACCGLRVDSLSVMAALFPFELGLIAGHHGRVLWAPAALERKISLQGLLGKKKKTIFAPKLIHFIHKRGSHTTHKCDLPPRSERLRAPLETSAVGAAPKGRRAPRPVPRPPRTTYVLKSKQGKELLLKYFEKQPCSNCSERPRGIKEIPYLLGQEVPLF